MKKTTALDFTFILKSTRFEDLMLPGEDRDQAFKRLAKIYHPDKHTGDAAVRANEVFQHINSLHQGNTKPAVQIGKWSIREPLIAGDIADLYLAETGGNVFKVDSVFKIARNRKDNDLMDREAAALKLLTPADGLKEPFSHYVPRLDDSLTASGRRANIIEYRPGYIPLLQIAERMGGTIDFRHIVWMMNRLLSILGWAHGMKIVHGAIAPDHLLYRPSDHDLLLVDWCYSVPADEKLKAILPKYKGFYPNDILSGRPATSGLDVYMAARSLKAMTVVPPRFQPILEWAVADSPYSRPTAWHMQDVWQRTAKEEYGEPKFVNLELPVH